MATAVEVEAVSLRFCRASWGCRLGVPEVLRRHGNDITTELLDGDISRPHTETQLASSGKLISN